jgi:hypothetical protein
MKSIIYICIVVGMWLFMPTSDLNQATAMANRVMMTQGSILPAAHSTPSATENGDYRIEALSIFGFFIGYCVVAVSLRSRNPTLRAD